MVRIQWNNPLSGVWHRIVHSFPFVLFKLQLNFYLKLQFVRNTGFSILCPYPSSGGDSQYQVAVRSNHSCDKNSFPQQTVSRVENGPPCGGTWWFCEARQTTVSVESTWSSCTFWTPLATWGGLRGVLPLFICLFTQVSGAECAILFRSFGSQGLSDLEAFSVEFLSSPPLLSPLLCFLFVLFLFLTLRHC